jgi:hypothetical protein
MAVVECASDGMHDDHDGSTLHSVSRNFPVRNIQTVRMFQYNIFSQ